MRIPRHRFLHRHAPAPRFARVVGVGIASADVGLIVAALDLQLVRLMRRAISDGKPGGVPPGPNPTEIDPRRRIEPKPKIEPRKRIEPTPRFEPRPVIRPEPRVEVRPCEPPHEPEMPVRMKSPIEPPWRVLPWEMPPQPAPKVKLSIYRPDVVSKGSLIDFFI